MKKGKDAKETQAPTPKERGKHTEIPLLPPDDPIFSRGPIVSGRELHGCTSIGSLSPDHPIYKVGPMIFGRPAKKERPEKK